MAAFVRAPWETPRKVDKATGKVVAPREPGRVPYGRSKIYSMVKEGRFPAPIKIDGCAVWLESEIAEWEAAQIAAARQQQPGGKAA